MKNLLHLSKQLSMLMLLCLMPVFAWAQSRITGTVNDEFGDPIVGATVQVKGTSIGAITDIDGNFSIEAPANSILTVRFVGYKAQEVQASNKPVVVALQEDSDILDEVVVVGYGQMKRSDLTGSVVSVNDAAIKKSVSTSVDQALQGRAAGVQIQANTGTPGGSSTIKIRGTNSLNATSQPIFVIDGVIVDAANGDDDGNSNPLASINPSDIVSMDVLKDASATAIYGARASNGVIMITTRRGQSGDAIITYDGYVGWQQMPKKLDVMNLQEFAQHWQDIADAGIRSASDQYVRPELLGEGTDWQSELFRTAVMHSHNLSVTGGNDKSTYVLSAGFLDQEGIAIGSDYRRLTLRGNWDAQIKKWLKGGISYSLADSKQTTQASNSIIMNALTSQPSIAVSNPDGEYGGPSENYQPSNPVAMALIVDNFNKKINNRLNTYLEATLVKGLTFKTELSVDYNLNKYYRYTPDYEFSEWNKNDTREGSWTKTDTKYWSWRNILNYTNTLAEKHSINAMLGQEMSHNHYETQYSLAQGFLSNTATDLSAGDYSLSRTNGFQNSSSLFSYFGRAFYSYDDRYLLTFTLRRDGSSKFAKDSRWGWFPSAALAWKISNEKFFEPIKGVMNNMKFRFGWGATGNQNVSDWAYMAMLGNYTTTWGVGVLNANTANPELKWETTYSTNVGLDLNFFDNRIEFIADYYYKKTKDLLLQKDLPAFLGSGAGSGYGVPTNPWANVGELENKGVEFTLNTVNVDKAGFTWQSNVVFSLNRNKVLSLDSETGSLPKTFQIGSETYTVTNTVVGESIGKFWGYKVIGRFNGPEDFYYKDAEGAIHQVALPEGVAIASSSTTDGAFVGDYIFADLNNDGVIDNNDQTFIGNPEPKFTWGFGNTFSYKGLDLSIQLSGSYGNDVMNLTRRAIENTGTTSNALKTILNAAKLEMIDAEGPDNYRNWKVSNPESTNLPRVSTSSASNGNYRISDNYIEDGSYIRLQNISISYTFPKKWMRKIKIDNLKIYCNLQNVYTWTKYEGYDPEVGSLYGDALKNGIDYGRYPSPKIYTVGLNLAF